MTPGEPDAGDFGGFAVEHRDAGVAKNLANLVLLAGFVVVVAKDGDDRNLDGRGQLARQDARLVRQTVVGEVTAQHQYVGVAGNMREEWLEGAL